MMQRSGARALAGPGIPRGDRGLWGIVEVTLQTHVFDCLVWKFTFFMLRVGV